MANLKPFVKGDPRCWRKGRPKSFDEVRAAAIQVAHEGATTANVLRILRDWATSSDVQKQRAFMEYSFGKVPDKIESDVNLKTKHVMHWPHERQDLIPSNGSNERN